MFCNSPLSLFSYLVLLPSSNDDFRNRVNKARNLFFAFVALVCVCSLGLLIAVHPLAHVTLLLWSPDTLTYVIIVFIARCSATRSALFTDSPTKCSVFSQKTSQHFLDAMHAYERGVFLPSPPPLLPARFLGSALSFMQTFQTTSLRATAPQSKPIAPQK